MVNGHRWSFIKPNFGGYWRFYRNWIFINHWKGSRISTIFFRRCILFKIYGTLFLKRLFDFDDNDWNHNGGWFLCCSTSSLGRRNNFDKHCWICNRDHIGNYWFCVTLCKLIPFSIVYLTASTNTKRRYLMHRR